MEGYKKSDVRGVGEEIASLFAVKTQPGFVKRNLFCVHEVGEGQERAFGVAICAMDEDLARGGKENFHWDVAFAVGDLVFAGFRCGLGVGEPVHPLTHHCCRVLLRLCVSVRCDASGGGKFHVLYSRVAALGDPLESMGIRRRSEVISIDKDVESGLIIVFRRKDEGGVRGRPEPDVVGYFCSLGHGTHLLPLPVILYVSVLNGGSLVSIVSYRSP